MLDVLLSQEPLVQNNANKKALLNKAESKGGLFKTLGWKGVKKTALACITYPLSEKNNLGLLEQIMPGLLEQNIKLALMGIGTQKYQNYFTQLANQYPNQIVILEESDSNKNDLYCAADILICPTDSDEGKQAIEQALKHQVVPVALNQTELNDYDAVKEVGNAFTFDQLTSWSLFATIIRALENFKFPYDWKNIQTKTG